MLTVFAVLAVPALVIAIMGGVGKWPLWLAVVLLSLIECLRCLPLGH